MSAVNFFSMQNNEMWTKFMYSAIESIKQRVVKMYN
jgi:hypothetical protein